MDENDPLSQADEIGAGMVSMLEQSRLQISMQANAALTMLNWHLGYLIDAEVLQRDGGEYSDQIVSTMSQQLTSRFGSGFDKTNLYRMVQFAQAFPDEQLAVTLSPQLSWSHIKELLPLSTSEARMFYAEEAIRKRLGVHDLRQAISRRSNERREIANAQIQTGSAIPLDAFKDPMLLYLLGLHDTYAEADLKQAILIELESFLMQVGRGFTFVGRQVRMPMGDENYDDLDILFFSRPLKRLIAVELKLGKYIPEYEREMKFYLKWLNKFERYECEKAPIGLILCPSAGREQIELMELQTDNIVVAEYWTELLPKAQLEERLKVILREARERVARRSPPVVTTTPALSLAPDVDLGRPHSTKC